MMSEIAMTSKAHVTRNHIAALVVCLASALASGGTAAAADAAVDQAGQKFSQPSLSIKAGDTVTFHNKDDVTHNINIIDSDGIPEDQGLQKPGEDIVKKFVIPGHYSVRCQIHPRMKMSIDVQ
jgi:cytochrome c peroxidase